MYIKFKRHAGSRIAQRIRFKGAAKVIKSIFKNELYLPIGYDLKKSHVKHCLFYIERVNDFYILCLDENNNEVLTVLFGYEFAGWNIDTQTYNEVRLKSINHSLQSNINQTFSYLDINLMKKSSKDYIFIHKYLEKNKLIVNKSSVITNKNNDSSFDSLHKRKSLLQENLEKIKNYEISEEDKALVKRHKEKQELYKINAKIKKGKYFEIYFEKLHSLGFKLISMEEQYFVCKFTFDYENNFEYSCVKNLFLEFNKNLEFKIHRTKKFNKENIKYYPNKEEVEKLAIYYLKLLKIKNYDFDLKTFLKQAGFGLFNNSVLIHRINTRKVKIENRS